MGQKKLLISVVMVIIFSMGIINYAIGFASDNDASISIADDGDFGNLGSDLETYSANIVKEGNTTDIGFFQRKTESEDELIKTGGSLKDVSRNSTTQGFFKVVTSIQNSIFGGKGSEFGIVFNLLLFLFSMITLMYIYKTIKGGNPD